MTEPSAFSTEGPSGALLDSLWQTGGIRIDRQLSERGYHPATRTDSALMPPAVAEHAITALTRPGDVVLDPDCGAGTTTVEALRADRHTIGLTDQPHWWRLARANVTAAKAHGAAVDGMVLVLDRRPGTSAVATTAGLTGSVDLLLTSLRPPGPIADPKQAVAPLRNLLSEYRPLLRPGGYVVITIAPYRHPVRHHLLDIPGELLAAATAAGLAPVARCLALTAGVSGQRVHTRAGYAQRRQAARIERNTGRRSALPAHYTVLVFRVDPDAADPALTLAAPTSPQSHRCCRRARSRAVRHQAA